MARGGQASGTEPASRSWVLDLASRFGDLRTDIGSGRSPRSRRSSLSATLRSHGSGSDVAQGSNASAHFRSSTQASSAAIFCCPAAHCVSHLQTLPATHTRLLFCDLNYTHVPKTHSPHYQDYTSSCPLPAPALRLCKTTVTRSRSRSRRRPCASRRACPC